jgi:hypothetical protein
MPSIELSGVFSRLLEERTQLATLHLQNLDLFKTENFQTLRTLLTSYKGLENLGLELLSFDLESVKQDLLLILLAHADKLKRLSLARNKVSTDLMLFLAQGLRQSFSVLETIDL